MTLAEIKDLIKSRTKTHCFNEELQDVILATDLEEILEAGISIFEWAYQAKIVDDNLLDEFPEITLNNYGIYSTGTFTLINPDKEIFVVKDAEVTINISDSKKVAVVCMGNSSVTINISGNGFCKVSANDICNINISLSDSAIVNIDARDKASLQIEQNDLSMLHIVSKGNSSFDLRINDSSTCIAYLYQHSAMVYATSGDGEFIPNVFNNSILYDKTSEV